MIAKYTLVGDTVLAGKQSQIILKLHSNSDTILNNGFLGSMIVDSVKHNDSTASIFYHSYSVGQTAFDSIPLQLKNSDSVYYLYGKGPFVIPHQLDTNYKSSYYGFADYPIPKLEVASIVVLLMLLGVALFFILKKLITPKPEPMGIMDFVKDKRKTPIEMYEELIKLKLWESGKVKDHYYGLAEIVKHFISLQTDVSFMETTTIEMQKKLNSDFRDFFGKDFLNQLKAFFNDIDIYRYTDVEPDVDTVIKHNNDVKNMITQNFKQENSIENT